jgi:hypothetical protein
MTKSGRLPPASLVLLFSFCAPELIPACLYLLFYRFERFIDPHLQPWHTIHSRNESPDNCTPLHGPVKPILIGIDVESNDLLQAFLKKMFATNSVADVQDAV